MEPYEISDEIDLRGIIKPLEDGPEDDLEYYRYWVLTCVDLKTVYRIWNARTATARKDTSITEPQTKLSATWRTWDSESCATMCLYLGTLKRIIQCL